MPSLWRPRSRETDRRDWLDRAHLQWSHWPTHHLHRRVLTRLSTLERGCRLAVLQELNEDITSLLMLALQYLDLAPGEIVPLAFSKCDLISVSKPLKESTALIRCRLLRDTCSLPSNVRLGRVDSSPNRQSFNRRASSYGVNGTSAGSDGRSDGIRRLTFTWRTCRRLWTLP